MVWESKIQAVTLESIEQFILDSGSDHLPTFGGSFEGGIQCQQVADELAPCIMAILESGEPIKSCLEIGSAAGGTAFLLDHFFKPGKIVLIDDNRHPKAHLRPYILRDITHEEIIGDSHAKGVIDSAAERGPFDIIIIDGDHSFEGVRADTENFFPVLRPGGFLIFHDSVCQECWGVHLVVEEVKNNGEAELIGEYVTQKHSRPCGIALFRKAVAIENQ